MPTAATWIATLSVRKLATGRRWRPREQLTSGRNAVLAPAVDGELHDQRVRGVAGVRLVSVVIIAQRFSPC